MIFDRITFFAINSVLILCFELQQEVRVCECVSDINRLKTINRQGTRKLFQRFQSCMIGGATDGQTTQTKSYQSVNRQNDRLGDALRSAADRVRLVIVARPVCRTGPRTLSPVHFFSLLVSLYSAIVIIRGYRKYNMIRNFTPTGCFFF